MSGWPDGVVVATPTVPRRAAPWSATAAMWARLGAPVVAEVQDPRMPLSHASHLATSHRALTRALDEHPDASHILFAEDDIDAGPDLPRRLGALADGRVVTLFLPGVRFYPARVRQAIAAGERLEREVVPVRGVSTWWGSQAVLLPRPVVEDVGGFASGRAGWDMHLRAWLRASGTRLWACVPNLVQHRGLPSLACARGGGAGRSVTYGWPTAGGAP